MKLRINTRNKIFVILLILMVSLSYVAPVRYMVYATSEDTQEAPAEIQEDSSEELPVIEGKDISEEDLNIEESTTEEPSSADDATEEIPSVEEGSNEFFEEAIKQLLFSELEIEFPSEFNQAKFYDSLNSKFSLDLSFSFSDSFIIFSFGSIFEFFSSSSKILSFFSS